jgi:hypothetical protein
MYSFKLKASILFFWISSIYAGFSQDWSPFYFNKRILFGTPDTLGGLLVGQSLGMVRFDTSFTINGRTTMFCKDGLGPDEWGSTMSNAKSLVSLYGKKMVKEGSNFWFFPQLPNIDSIKYNAKAGQGEIILKSSNITGIVISKIFEQTSAGMDSIKIISISETQTSGPVQNYTGKLSKNNGFLKIPAFFNWYSDRRDEFTYYADYDSDPFKLKTNLQINNKYKLGDIILNTRYGRFSQFYWYDSVKTEVISVVSDSCILLDSVKSYSFNTNSESIYKVIRKIKNENFN